MGLDVDVVEVEVVEIVEVSETVASVTEVSPVVGTVIEVTAEAVVVSETIHTVFIEVEVGIPGPPGPAGPSGDEEMKYSERNDFVGDDVIYKGEAVPGSSEADAVWRICKVTFTGDDIEKQWANGNADFANSWTSRATLGYS